VRPELQGVRHESDVASKFEADLSSRYGDFAV